MATIASPRRPGPRHKISLVDLTSSRINLGLKRYKRSKSKYSSPESSSSLRQNYLASSNTLRIETEGTQRSQSSDKVPEIPAVSPISQFQMASPVHFDKLPPPPLSEISSSGSSTIFGPNPDQISTPKGTPIKFGQSSLEKKLPPKPSLRAKDSPERRGVFDARDLTSTSLNGRYPVLEPTSSPDSFNSAQQSPAYGSFKVTASLLSSDLSPNSGSSGVIEYGFANSTSIQSLNQPYELEMKQLHDESIKIFPKITKGPSDIQLDASSSNGYALAAPGSVEQPRITSLRHDGYQLNGSPSRPSRRYTSGLRAGSLFLPPESKFSNRRNRGPVRPSTPAPEADLRLPVQNDAIANKTSSAPTSINETASQINEIKRDSHRSSKYGYNVRESFDARDVIMGQDLKVEKLSQNGDRGRMASSKFTRNSITRELSIRLITPEAKRRSNKEGDLLAKSNDNSKVLDQRFAPKPSVLDRKHVSHANALSPHPPRTSSLIGSTSAIKASASEIDIKISRSPLADQTPKSRLPKPIKAGSRLPNSTPPVSSTSQTSGISMLYRQTAASAARASGTDKKNFNSQSTTSRMSHSRTLSSISDVGKGMKRLGKRVGKIIPGRRSAAVSLAVKDQNGIESMEYDSTSHLLPSREASHLLHVYKKGEMTKNSAHHTPLSAESTDSSDEFEPTEKHEPASSSDKRKAWQEAPPDPITYHPGMDISQQAVGGHGIRLNNSGDEPPTPPFTDTGYGTHYVENHPLRDEDLPDTQRGSPASSRHDITHTNAADSVPASNNAINTGTNHSFQIENVVQNLLPSAEFDQMLSETDAHAQSMMQYALSLQESPLRRLMLEAATSLEQSLMRVREARMEVIRMGRAVDEMSVVLTNNGLRMALYLHGSNT